MSLAKLTRIPKYVRATNADLLRRSMLANNLKNQKMYNYFQIIKDGRFLYAWFYDDVEDEALINEVNREGVMNGD